MIAMIGKTRGTSTMEKLGNRALRLGTILYLLIGRRGGGGL